MKDKGLIISTILIIAAITGVLVVSNKPKEKAASSFFESINNNFCFNQNCLSKQDGDWRVRQDGKDKPADNDIVDSMIGTIKKIVLEETVSTNANKFADFGFDKTAKFILSVDSKKLEIGNVNRGYNGTFVKEENGDRVYLIDLIIDKSIVLKDGYWDRKKVTDWPIRQISSLTVKHKGKEIPLYKKGDAWENAKLAEKAMQLPAIKFLDNFEAKSSDEYQIEAKDGEEKKYTLLTGVKYLNGKPIYWASANNKDYFEISREDYVLLTAIKF